MSSHFGLLHSWLARLQNRSDFCSHFGVAARGDELQTGYMACSAPVCWTSHHRTFDHRENIWAWHSGAFTSGFSDFQQWWKFLQVGYGLCLVRLGWILADLGNAPGGYNNPTMMGGIPKNQLRRFSRIRKSLAKRPWVLAQWSRIMPWWGDVMCLRKLRQKEWLKSCNPWDQRRCNTFWTGKRTFSRRRQDINPRKGNTKKRYTDVFYQKAGMLLRCFEGFPFDIFVFCWLFVDYCSPCCLDVGHFPDSGAVLLHVETCWNSGSLWNHLKSSLESKTNSWDGGYVV